MLQVGDASAAEFSMAASACWFILGLSGSVYRKVCIMIMEEGIVYLLCNCV